MAGYRINILRPRSEGGILEVCNDGGAHRELREGAFKEI